MLPNPANLKYPYPSTMLITTTSYVKSRPQTLENFLKATLKGIKYAKSHKKFTVKILGKYTPTKDTKLLDSALQTDVLGYIRNVPTVSSGEIKKALEELASRNSRAKGTDPRQFYDPAPMEQLVKEGFVKRLYP